LAWDEPKTGRSNCPSLKLEAKGKGKSTALVDIAKSFDFDPLFFLKAFKDL
jgi:hypothetical protein